MGLSGEGLMLSPAKIRRARRKLPQPTAKKENIIPTGSGENSPYQATAVFQTTDACPSQWGVNALPRPLYVRYRFGVLSVNVDKGDELGDELLTLWIGDPLDGTMTTEEMMAHTASLIDWSYVRKSGAGRTPHP